MIAGDLALTTAQEPIGRVEARGGGAWAAHGINVNAVCPGGVDTPMLLSVAEWITARAGGDPHALVKEMKPRQMSRHVQPIEVGRVVAFLLSYRAVIIRGQAINVDGGDTPY